MITPQPPAITGSSIIDGNSMEEFSKQMQAQQQRMTAEMMVQQMQNSRTQMEVGKVNAFKEIVKSVQV